MEVTNSNSIYIQKCVTLVPSFSSGSEAILEIQAKPSLQSRTSSQFRESLMLQVSKENTPFRPRALCRSNTSKIALSKRTTSRSRPVLKRCPTAASITLNDAFKVRDVLRRSKTFTYAEDTATNTTTTRNLIRRSTIIYSQKSKVRKTSD